MAGENGAIFQKVGQANLRRGGGGASRSHHLLASLQLRLYLGHEILFVNNMVNQSLENGFLFVLSSD